MRRKHLQGIALVVFALSIAGCGGGGEETKPASTGSSPSAEIVRDDFSGVDEQSGTSRKTPNTAELPEPVEGSKSAAPGVPVRGDTSIQTWGLEASAAQREQVAAIFQAFVDARAEADWAKACSYLAVEQIQELARLIAGRESAKARCAEAMEAFASRVPSSAFKREAQIADVLSLRVGRGTAFLIYTRPDGPKVYANALGREGGTWKVVSIGPTALE
jgi:hypothetical protein